MKLLLRANMSADGTRTNVLFEGFLQKRKDNMRVRWVTYWFRLQNTTLFFYTKKNGSASHLKGNYYIYTVQSVREVQRADGRRFMFEIIMNNGKRKLLAAETEALRQEWVEHLWKAMHLSTHVVSRGTHLEVCELLGRINISTPVCLHSDVVMASLSAGPPSAPTGYTPPQTQRVSLPICPSEGLSREDTTESSFGSQPNIDDYYKSPQLSSGVSDVPQQEGDYDVLPVRKSDMEATAQIHENIYAVPSSYRWAAEDPDSAENIYDVPSFVLRKMSDHGVAFSSDEQLKSPPDDRGSSWRDP